MQCKDNFLASVQFSCSVVSDFVTPWTAAYQASLSITNSWSLLKLMSVELVMPSNHLILCHPLLLLPSIFPRIGFFSKESVIPIRWPKYWTFSFSISPSNEYSGLISLRIDWFDFLAVQGTLKSLLQHHSSKASILYRSAFFMVQLSHAYMTTGKTIDLTKWLTYTWSILQKFKFNYTSKVHSSKASILQHSAFFIVQLSHPYMTIGKTIALTRWTFVDKVMFLLFNMLSKVGHSFSSKEQASFNFMAAITICSDSGAQNVCDSLQPHGLYLCPWNFSGKNTCVGCLSLLQGIFPTQGSNPGPLHLRQILTAWTTREAHFQHGNKLASLQSCIYSLSYCTAP